MHRFIKLPIDWPTHIELNPDMLEQSAHGKNEQPKGCTCDVCHEWFIFAALEQEQPEEMFTFCTFREFNRFPNDKQIEEQWKFPEVDGCKCHRRRCQVHQFKLFWREHQELVKERSKLMDDWSITIYLDEQLRDLADLHLRHAQFIKKLSDAGFRREHQRYRKWVGNVKFTSLETTEGWYLTSKSEYRAMRLANGDKLLWDELIMWD
ncbi:hypothetical protein OCU04_007955 [Sclerotinia nivalis]|uniref:Uncharacterized protein n=1 Tax=Sclerotinia nivalis TaxID=352851 RepID=A0A9X0AKR3_9HELO|nr:hypothetical protein OCU04_007955 [Sclerotinia nivalis]